MSPAIRITGRLTAAGRALAGVSDETFATAAGLAVEDLACLEAAGSAWIGSQESAFGL